MVIPFLCNRCQTLKICQKQFCFLQFDFNFAFDHHSDNELFNENYIGCVVSVNCVVSFKVNVHGAPSISFSFFPLSHRPASPLNMRHLFHWPKTSDTISVLCLHPTWQHDRHWHAHTKLLRFSIHDSLFLF